MIDDFSKFIVSYAIFLKTNLILKRNLLYGKKLKYLLTLPTYYFHVKHTNIILFTTKLWHEILNNLSVTLNYTCLRSIQKFFILKKCLCKIIKV